VLWTGVLWTGVLWTARRLRVHTEAVGARPERHSNREWFVDRRTPDRRLQVTWHTDHRTAVLSTWQGDTCTGTFQLPIEDTARLIAHLADGLSTAATAPAPTPSPNVGWRARLLRKLGRARADVLPFRR
jgi:hypothetical protein